MTLPNQHFSRRTFIAGSGALVLSAALKAVETFAIQPPEPVIDIHQHTHYHGWTHEQMITHQNNMGISNTILLPAGSSVNTASTHSGYSNGLEAQAGGNAVCYEFAKNHPGKFVFWRMRSTRFAQCGTGN